MVAAVFRLSVGASTGRDYTVRAERVASVPDPNGPGAEIASTLGDNRAIVCTCVSAHTFSSSGNDMRFRLAYAISLALTAAAVYGQGLSYRASASSSDLRPAAEWTSMPVRSHPSLRNILASR